MTTYMIMLTLIVLAREYTNYKHDIKRDELIDTLTNKLMARDFTEYHDAITPPQTFEPVAKDDEDLYYQEIQDNKR